LQKAGCGVARSIQSHADNAAAEKELTAIHRVLLRRGGETSDAGIIPL
jgi:hypothetical protein